ncbi:MAG: amidohydrolase [Armatimonadetes bacterium]|nr:amidohydrolase [Armatimonadota bacterium]
MTYADLLLFDGRVWTGLSDRPDAEAIAVSGGRIVAVGTTADLFALDGPDTRYIDLEGRLATPGFHDCHVHFAGGCLQLGRVQLKDAKDEAEFGKRLREFDRTLPEGAWMRGGRWDHDRTFGGALPTAALIDRYVANRPVFLQRYDGHMAVANSLALRIAGVTRSTAGPPGGRIVRYPATGEPTGVLQDEAMGLVWRHIPAPTAGEIAAALPAGLALAARMGVTSVHDMLGDGGPCLEAYRRLDERGELPLRLNLYWPISRWQEAVGVARAAPPVSADGTPERIRLCGVKAFVDGSLGSSTAWFHEPYANQPGDCGFPVVEMAELAEQMHAARAAGLQVAAHAIGDRAVSELLDAMDGPQHGLRIEHAQHIRPQDVPRLAEAGVVASMQPYHAIDDARWMAERIGEARCAEAFPFRSLLDAGVALAFGSDWPVAPLDVMAGIDAAVNRRPVDGTYAEGWHPEQRIGVPEALVAYTRNAARAALAQEDLGTLEPGKQADLVVLDRDITDPVNRDAITETSVVLTMLAGTECVPHAPG